MPELLLAFQTSAEPRVTPSRARMLAVAVGDVIAQTAGMFIVDLACDRNHSFEGWYDSRAEYEEIRDGNELSCPLCGSLSVTRELSANAIHSSSSASSAAHVSLREAPANEAHANEAHANEAHANEAHANEAHANEAHGNEAHGRQEGGTPMPLEMQQALAKVVQHVRKTHEDVGPAFTETAIKMWRGDEQQRPIRGESTPEGDRQLSEHGVPVMKLPIPDIEVN